MTANNIKGPPTGGFFMLVCGKTAGGNTHWKYLNFHKSKNPSAPTLRFSIQLNQRKLRRNLYMTNHTSKSQLKVDGKMSESGADYAGKIQSYAVLIVAISILISAIDGLAWLFCG